MTIHQNVEQDSVLICMQGYIKIARGHHGCGIATDPVYSVFKSTQAWIVILFLNRPLLWTKSIILGLADCSLLPTQISTYEPNNLVACLLDKEASCLCSSSLHTLSCMGCEVGCRFGMYRKGAGLYILCTYVGSTSPYNILMLFAEHKLPLYPIVVLDSINNRLNR